MKKKDYKSLSLAELLVQLDELKRKYMDLRFQFVVGHVENPML
ncbi:MAG: 50S ribosomal protein L29, partial [Treponema sp.]